jgi:restriction system protein
MQKVNRCLKEWNSTVEALGHGKQTFLIRSYDTALEGFFLYPTGSYSIRKGYLDAFKEDYYNFVEENSLPRKKGKQTEIKYYADVVKIIKKPNLSINRLLKYHIWTNEHVRDYLKNSQGYIWLLRVHKLKRPFYADESKAIRYVKLKRGVSTDGMIPVINDDDFNKVYSKIN